MSLKSELKKLLGMGEKRKKRSRSEGTKKRRAKKDARRKDGRFKKR
jgi:hypothetical protein